MAEQKQYLRFTLPQRLEHWALTISFTTLAVTGLPQKFAGNGWAEWMIGVMGGIQTVRTVHHAAAVVLCLVAIYHVIVVAYKVFVLRVRWSIFPRLEDVVNGIDVIRYNLGLAPERPKLDRYSYEEKMEYWAVIWGTIIMGATGFVLWNPITAARFFPGEIIPAAKAAHGAEAILAVLAILIWHFYNVHVKTFNKTVFTGKLTEHQMREEHGLELERLQKGKTDPVSPPPVIKQRERAFIPGATFAAVVMVAGLYMLTSLEQTAITGLPPATPFQVYAPITATPTAPAAIASPAPTGVAVGAKPLPADHAGRTTCLSCHANMTQPALPADHAGRTDATCTACHKPAEQTGPTATAPATPTAPTPTPAVTSASATSESAAAAPP